MLWALVTVGRLADGNLNGFQFHFLAITEQFTNVIWTPKEIFLAVVTLTANAFTVWAMGSVRRSRV